MEWRIHLETEPVDVCVWSDRIEDVMDAFEGVEGIIGLIAWSRAAGFGFTFIVERDTAIDALAFGHDVFRAALGKAGRTESTTIIEVDPPEEEEGSELVGATDIARMLGVSRQRVYQLLGKPGFPEPARRLARGALWNRREIDAWATTARRRSA
jgi:prophage regulatory protein